MSRTAVMLVLMFDPTENGRQTARAALNLFISRQDTDQESTIALNL
jgi:hypothetical protein